MQSDYPFRVASGANKIPVTAVSAPTPKGATFTSGSGIGQNRLYALITCSEFEASPHVVAGMLKIFSHDVYDHIHIYHSFDIRLSLLINLSSCCGRILVE